MRSSPPPSDGMAPTVPVGRAERYHAGSQARGSAGARLRRQHQRGTRRRPPRTPSRRSPAPTCSTCTPTPTTTAPCSRSSARRPRRALATRAVELPGHPGPRGCPPAVGRRRRRPVRPPRRRRSWSDAIAARDAFATWLTSEHEVPCFVYGPERSLPDVRRHAFRDLAPDVGPASPHPTAGATAVGARHPLVAFNVWMASPDLAVAKQVAAAIRGPAIRALGLQVGDATQVSMNLVEPLVTGPARSPSARPPAPASGGRLDRSHRAGRAGAGGRAPGDAGGRVERPRPRRGPHDRSQARSAGGRKPASAAARDTTGSVPAVMRPTSRRCSRAITSE